MSGFNTSLLHDGVDDYPNGATLVPIYQSSAFKHESAEELERIFDNKRWDSHIRESIIRR